MAISFWKLLYTELADRKQAWSVNSLYLIQLQFAINVWTNFPNDFTNSPNSTTPNVSLNSLFWHTHSNYNNTPKIWRIFITCGVDAWIVWRLFLKCGINARTVKHQVYTCWELPSTPLVLMIFESIGSPPHGDWYCNVYLLALNFVGFCISINKCVSKGCATNRCLFWCIPHRSCFLLNRIYLSWCRVTIQILYTFHNPTFYRGND